MLLSWHINCSENTNIVHVQSLTFLNVTESRITRWNSHHLVQTIFNADPFPTNILSTHVVLFKKNPVDN